MPRLIDTETRTYAVVAAINDVLVHEGVQELTLRRVAKLSGISTSSLLHHYGSREHLFRVAASRTGEARIEDIQFRSYGEGVAAFFPASDIELAHASAWHAWLELTRCEPAWQRLVHDLRDRERGLLAATLGLPYADDRVTEVHALVHGLIAAARHPVRPLDPATATRILRAHPRVSGSQHADEE